MYPLCLSVSQILISAISFWWAVRKYKLVLIRPKLKDCIKLLWEEKIFFFSLCMINLYTTTNIVVLGLIHDSTNVGYYTAGQKLISIIQMVITVPLAQSIFPYVGGALKDNRDHGLEIIHKLISLVFIATLLLAIAILFMAPSFIFIFYGRAFAPAIAVCRILAFIPMTIALGTILGIHLMLNLKMDNIFFKITCIGAVTSVILNLALVEKIGYRGTAFAWTISEFINVFMLCFFLNKKGIKFMNLKYFNLSWVVKDVGEVRSILLKNQKIVK